MEDIKRNKAVVGEGLQKRKNARKEAIRKEEEAHTRIERDMLNLVHTNAVNSRKQDDEQSASRASKEAEKKEAVRQFKRKRALARAIDDGNDYMLQIWVSGGAIVFADILGRIGFIPMLTSVVARILLVVWFGFNIYRLYQVSGAIARLSNEG